MCRAPWICNLFGCVKSDHGGVGIGTPPGGIHASAVSIFPFTGFPVDGTSKSCPESCLGSRRIDRGPELFGAQQTTEEQSLISDHFGGQAEPGSAGQEMVGRVKG